MVGSGGVSARGAARGPAATLTERGWVALALDCDDAFRLGCRGGRHNTRGSEAATARQVGTPRRIAARELTLCVDDNRVRPLLVHQLLHPRRQPARKA